METKICSICNKELPIDQYYVIYSKKQNKDYTYNYCKACHYVKTKPIAKKWREENREQWNQDVKNALKAMFNRDLKGVYMLITNKGLYIGQTDKFRHRVHQHKNPNFKGNVAFKGAKILQSVLLEEIDDTKKRKQREKYWIKKFKPELNIHYNDDYYRDGHQWIKK